MNGLLDRFMLQYSFRASESAVIILCRVFRLLCFCPLGCRAALWDDFTLLFYFSADKIAFRSCLGSSITYLISSYWPSSANCTGSKTFGWSPTTIFLKGDLIYGFAATNGMIGKVLWSWPLSFWSFGRIFLIKMSPTIFMYSEKPSALGFMALSSYCFYLSKA